MTAFVSVAVAAEIARVQPVTIRVWRSRGYLNRYREGVALAELLARMDAKSHCAGREVV